MPKFGVKICSYDSGRDKSTCFFHVTLFHLSNWRILKPWLFGFRRTKGYLSTLYRTFIMVGCVPTIFIEIVHEIIFIFWFGFFLAFFLTYILNWITSACLHFYCTRRCAVRASAIQFAHSATSNSIVFSLGDQISGLSLSLFKQRIHWEGKMEEHE